MIGRRSWKNGTALTLPFLGDRTMVLSVTDPIERAIDRTKTILFNPLPLASETKR